VHRSLGVTAAPQVPEFLIDAAYASNAALAIVPMQDLLALDSRSRMNSPGTTLGNWQWRFTWEQVDPALVTVSHRRAERANRLVRAVR
jgi:4-alpha-glucanotransferase